MNDAFVRCLLFQLDCPRNKKALITSVAHTFPSRESCKVFFSHLLVGSGKKGCDLVFCKFSHQLASLFDVVLCNNSNHTCIYIYLYISIIYSMYFDINNIYFYPIYMPISIHILPSKEKHPETKPQTTKREIHTGKLVR